MLSSPQARSREVEELPAAIVHSCRSWPVGSHKAVPAAKYLCLEDPPSCRQHVHVQRAVWQLAKAPQWFHHIDGGASWSRAGEQGLCNGESGAFTSVMKDIEEHQPCI